MTGKRIGYIRVSTPEQNPDRQLENVELDERFIEYASARTTERPQLKLMLKFIRKDDILYVHSMDRLSRSLVDLIEIVDLLTSRKITVKFIKEGLEFTYKTNPVSKLILHIIGACAEFQIAFMREIQMEGIAIARSQGRLLGRNSKYTPEIKERIKSEMETRKTKVEIAKSVGISRTALYKYMHKMRAS